MTAPKDRRASSDFGASAVEYALLITFIATVIFGTVVVLGGDVIDLFGRANWWD